MPATPDFEQIAVAIAGRNATVRAIAEQLRLAWHAARIGSMTITTPDLSKPDFEQIARALVGRVSPPMNYIGLDRPVEGYAYEHQPLIDAISEQLRLVWNARGAADLIATFSTEPPCRTFSVAEDDQHSCKHCGWTDEAHTQAEALRGLDR